MSTDFSWPDIVGEAIGRWPTPFYVVAWEPIARAMDELEPLQALGLQIRHWFSVKTQPVRPLLETWRERTGWGAEVISQFELHAARACGYPAEDILVNGLSKHTWLPHDLSGLNVHFDSVGELDALDLSILNASHLGARCAVPSGLEPDDPTVGAQFGMDEAELRQAVRRLRRAGLTLDGLQFHLRSNIRTPAPYLESVESAMAMAHSAGITPRYLDCGGGFPVPGEVTVERGHEAGGSLSIGSLAADLSHLLGSYPSIQEVWFENGRFVTARSAVLVLRVTDIKDRSDCRFVICDGGRTNHALPADWEHHEILTVPSRTGPTVKTIICGPTCTAYDRLAVRDMPDEIAVGDCLVWLRAGAYHLSWETRFSHGLARVIWCDGDRRLRSVRPPESPAGWWGVWADGDLEQQS